MTGSTLAGSHAAQVLRAVTEKHGIDTRAPHGEQLRPKLFQQTCRGAGRPFKLRLQRGHGHSYWFVRGFIEDHLRHHARAP